MNQSTLLLEEHPANRSRSRDLEAEWPTRVVTWLSNFYALLAAHAPNGWYGRTCPVSCRRMVDGILEESDAARRSYLER